MGAAAVPLLIATTAVGAGTAAAGAIQANQAAKAQGRARGRQAKVEADSISRAATVEKMKRQQQLHRLRGRVRTLSSSAGTGVGGSVEAQLRQLEFDGAASTAIANLNEQGARAQLDARLRASEAELSSRTRSLILDGLGGALSGAATGLALGNGMSDLGTLQAQQGLLPNGPTPGTISHGPLPPRPEF